MSKVLPAITLAGVTYRVLRLDGRKRGPRFVLRSDDGDLFGLYAVPLIVGRGETNPLQQVEFFDSDGRLTARS